MVIPTSLKSAAVCATLKFTLVIYSEKVVSLAFRPIHLSIFFSKMHSVREWHLFYSPPSQPVSQPAASQPPQPAQQPSQPRPAQPASQINQISQALATSTVPLITHTISTHLSRASVCCMPDMKIYV